MMKSIKGFTLIELLIVIVIIGILATALIPRLKGMQAKARDTQRIADLKQIQTALEMYANDNNGNYPSTALSSDPNILMWRGNCNEFGGYGIVGPNAYIPNLAPTYLTTLPLDPKPTPKRDPLYREGCYLYRSNGVDYALMAFLTVEGPIPPEYMRQKFHTGETFSVYSPGGKFF